MNLNTPICKMFGIRYPIFSAGMGGFAMAPLAGAVSEAGGLGALGATFLTPDELREEIRKVRTITNKPFAVNLLIPEDIKTSQEQREIPPLPDFLSKLAEEMKSLKGTSLPTLTTELARAQVDVVIEEKVPILVSGLGTPSWLVPLCHKASMKVISVAGSVRHAKKVEERGVDVVVAQGMEAGGHVGSIATMVLVPNVVDAVRIPVLAAGGIVDGRGVAASLMLGASGVWIGTRFLATHEATTAEGHKQKVVELGEGATTVCRAYTGKPSRVLRNRFTDLWKDHEELVMPMPYQRKWMEPIVNGARAAGNVDVANYPASQNVTGIKELLSAKEVVDKLVSEASALLAK